MEHFLSWIGNTATDFLGVITDTASKLFDMLVVTDATSGTITGPSVAGYFVGLGILGGLIATGVGLFSRISRARR